MFKRKSTLTRRVSKIIALLTFSIFFLFTVVVFLIAYSIEDATFNQQLTQASQDFERGIELPSYIKKKQNLSEYDFDLGALSLTTEYHEETLSGEFTFEKRHYHYLKMQGAWLVMDVTDITVVSRGFRDIVFALFLMLICSLLLSYVITKQVTVHALKPFDKLSKLLKIEESDQISRNNLLADISEVDVKAVAEKLEKTLTEKRNILEQQLIFNQGMSHEIRSPLQVMTHSVELLDETIVDNSQRKYIDRLSQALIKIERISDALLWLTTKESFNQSTDVSKSLDLVVNETQNLIAAHNICIEIEVMNNCFLPVPEKVIELIIFHLINNSIQHLSSNKHDSNLRVLVNEELISFSNLKLDKNDTTKGFGLGLMIIEKLAQRFDLKLSKEETQTEFSVVLRM